MEKFFANLKRLLDPRAQPPAESTEQPTADRPPPLAEAAAYREPEPPPYQGPAPPDVSPADDVSGGGGRPAGRAPPGRSGLADPRRSFHFLSPSPNQVFSSTRSQPPMRRPYPM